MPWRVVNSQDVQNIHEVCVYVRDAVKGRGLSYPYTHDNVIHVVDTPASARTTDKLPWLQGLDIKVAAGSKVGVVGRTGAGKSSLINTLFRLMELDAGVIRVDGVDISQLGLHQLRGALAIIPQVCRWLL